MSFLIGGGHIIVTKTPTLGVKGFLAGPIHGTQIMLRPDLETPKSGDAGVLLDGFDSELADDALDSAAELDGFDGNATIDETDADADLDGFGSEIEC